jgi:hypothetical protein
VFSGRKEKSEAFRRSRKHPEGTLVRCLKRLPDPVDSEINVRTRKKVTRNVRSEGSVV